MRITTARLLLAGIRCGKPVAFAERARTSYFYSLVHKLGLEDSLLRLALGHVIIKPHGGWTGDLKR